MVEMELPGVPDVMDSAVKSAGYSGIFNIVITVLCIWGAWWALQNFRFDLFVKQPKSPQAKVLMIMLSVGIGYSVASFIIEYLSWSITIKWLF